MNQTMLRITGITASSFLIASLFLLFNEYKLKLDLENTVSPILHNLAMNTCDYQNIQVNASPATGADLIFKREKISSCSSGYGNVVYARCHQWDHDEKGLWKLPTHDIKITGAYSCIDEERLNLSLFDEKLQQANIGEKYYVNLTKE